MGRAEFERGGKVTIQVRLLLNSSDCLFKSLWLPMYPNRHSYMSYIFYIYMTHLAGLRKDRGREKDTEKDRERELQSDRERDKWAGREMEEGRDRDKERDRYVSRY